MAQPVKEIFLKYSSANDGEIPVDDISALRDLLSALSNLEKSLLYQEYFMVV